MGIYFVKGDATNPVVEDGIRVLPHVCNNLGGWGAGYVLALSKKWKDPEESYRSKTKYILGDIDCVVCDEKTIVANMIAQNNYMTKNNTIPLRYNSLKECLQKLKLELDKYTEKVTIHMPRIGCGLAGGKWNKVEKLLNEELGDYDIWVYDYDPKRK